MSGKNSDGTEQTGLEIAVIGMSARFPGARNINEFWENLKNGIESISYFSEEEVNGSGVPLESIKDPNYVKAAALIEDVEYFDGGFFGYTPMEAELLAPHVRLFHECTWSALEDAGYEPLAYDGLIGLYAGSSSSSHWEGATFFSGKREMLGEFSASILTDKDQLSTQIAYNLNLRGPSFTLNTACSTSLVAIHLACQGLLSGECKIAVAGGVTVFTSRQLGYLYQEGSIYSSDGHCRTFDARADGCISGEGVGCVVLKALEEALEDEDHIYAIIKGSAINNDGNDKVGYTAPSVTGQASVIRMALQAADVEPQTIGYIETHGTGTKMGDPIEITALEVAYNTDKKGFCPIGSVKANVGHLINAAGAAGFIKTILSIKNKLIPPGLHFEISSPEIDFENSPFYVNSRLTEWRHNGHPLRAGVSSFGIGGTNAHVILEEAPEIETCQKSRKWKLILLSAKTQWSLDKAAENLAAYLKKNPGINLADAAYTLQIGRKAFEFRRMMVCSTIDDAVDLLASPDSRKARTTVTQGKSFPVVFMFPGLGGEYVNMGLGLYQDEPLFYKEIDRCFEILNPLMGFDVKEVLYPQTAADHGKIHAVDMAQVVIFIFEYALAKLLMEWGIQPDAMIGYSFGEYTAACISGVFSLEQALELVVFRGQLLREIPVGAMLSVPLSKEELTTLLNEELSIAVDNGPSCIVAGSKQAVDTFEKELKEKKYLCVRLASSHAVHSKMMEPILKKFESKIRRFKLNSPQIPYMSNLTGGWIKAEEAMDPAYWCKHLRETVQFADGIKELLKNPDTLFIEVGAGHDLSSLMARHVDDETKHKIINLIKHPQKDVPDLYFLLNKIGQLWLHGKKIDWKNFYTPESRQRLSLPTYPFEQNKSWIEEDLLKETPNVSSKPSILEKKTDIADWFYIPSWKRIPMAGHKHRHREKWKEFNWLVFLDDLGLGTRIVKNIEQRNQKIILVRKGQEFRKVGEKSYTINPQVKDDYRRLFDDCPADNRIPGNIIHLWGIAELEQKEPDIEQFNRVQASGLYSLVFLTQTIAKHRLNCDFKITVVSENIHEITGDETLYPGKATVIAPIKTISQEFPNIRCRSLDVDFSHLTERQKEKLSQLLLAEFLADSSDTIIAYRNNYRWVQTFEPYPMEETRETIPLIKRKGVYLITGGLGNIGFILSKYLVNHARAKLVLTGRTVLPPREEWGQRLALHDENDKTIAKIRKVKELEKMGGEVLVYGVDVSNYQQMQDVIVQTEQKFGRINGVIHAAGATDPGSFKTINEISEVEFNCHFQSKVYGLLVLKNVLKNKKLDFCYLISSLSPILGGLGFTAYSAANLFMDKFVYKYNRTDSTLWLAVNWADWQFPWEKGQKPLLGSKLAKLNMTPAEGMETFKRILDHCDLNQVVVSTGDLNTRLEQWVKLVTIREKNHLDKKSASNFTSRPNLMTSYVAPRNKLEQVLVEVWQELFGIENIGINDDFFELGGDSLLGMTLVNRLKELLQEIVHITVVFEARTVADLAVYLSKHYPEAVSETMGLKMEPEVENTVQGVNVANVDYVRHLIASTTPVYPGDGAEEVKNPPAIFILSPPRSGSTLLRVLLGGHKKLFAPPELELLHFKTLKERSISFSDRDNSLLQGTVRAVMQLKNCCAREAEHLMKEFENQDMSVKAFYYFIQKEIGDRTLVEKTPSYSINPRVLKAMENLFENPLYIHLTRHPYGMIRSYDEAKIDLLMEPRIREQLSFSRKELAELTWTISHRNILEFLADVPDNRKYCVKFEDLVTQPQIIIGNICRFLGQDFHPGMLQPYEEKKQRMTNGVHEKGLMIGDVKFHQHKKIDPSVADSWKKHYKVDFLGDVTRQLAGTFGYKTIAEPVKKKTEFVISRTERGNAQQLLRSLDQVSDQDVDALLMSMLERDRRNSNE